MNELDNNFLREIAKAIEVNDSGRLSDMVSDFSAFCFKETPPASDVAAFSEDFINELMKLMADERFLSMEDSFKLIALLQNDWGRLSSDQRLEVVRFLEGIYGKLKDSTSQLVIVELLGEYLANHYSIEALDRLRSISDETARAHVAHGYKCLALNVADECLKGKATARLRAMDKDPSEIVRQEVAAAMAELSR